MGLSRREFAKREGCSEGAVRNALKQGRLLAMPDGTLDPGQLGGQWFRNIADSSKRCAKREAYAAQVAQVTQVSTDIPADVAHHYGWDDANHDDEVTEAFGALLCLRNVYQTDPESIAHSLALHAESMLTREAYRLGWREDEPGYGTSKRDEDPIDRCDETGVGPNDFGVKITVGLVRKLGEIVDVFDPEDPFDKPIDINDPIMVAGRMVFLAMDIIEDDLRRRRRAAGIKSVRDKD